MRQELLGRLVSAAQAVGSDAEVIFEVDLALDGKYSVEAGYIDELKEVVKVISDEAIKEITAIFSRPPVDDKDVILKMDERGGGFVRALAGAAVRADPDNMARIKATWPEYWDEYTRMVVADKQNRETQV